MQKKEEVDLSYEKSKKKYLQWFRAELAIVASAHFFQ